MLYVLELNRRDNLIVTHLTFEDSQQSEAESARAEIELRLKRQNLDHEVFVMHGPNARDSLHAPEPAWRHHPPGVYFEAIPSDERKHCDTINSAIHALDHQIDYFRKSLSLFDQATSLLMQAYAQQPREDRARLDAIDLYHHWRIVAARDCALTIYDFGRVRDRLHESLGRAPTLRGMIDSQKLRVASRLFETYFGNYVQLRHGVAHAEDKQKSPEEVQKHVIKESSIANRFNQPWGGTALRARHFCTGN